MVDASLGQAKPKVWATLVTNPSYVAGLLTVHHTLRAVSAYPLVVLATDTLPSSSRAIINNAGMEIIDVPHLSPAAGQHQGFDPSFARFNDAWTKLAVFGLEQYERVILIDADMIFLRGMDDLFEMELQDGWIAAAPACVCNPFKIADYPADWIPANCSISQQNTYSTLTSPSIPPIDGPRTSHLLNSGLVVIPRPSRAALADLVHFLNTDPSVAKVRFADQDIIASAYKGRWQPLPWWANALKPVRGVHPGVWKDEEVRLIHYILAKPWESRPTSIPSPGPIDPKTDLPSGLVELVRNSPPQESLRDYKEVHLWWWVAYEAMLADMREKGDERWKEVDAGVAQIESA